MICCLSPIFASCMEKENTADEDLVGDWFKRITGLGDLNTLCSFCMVCREMGCIPKEEREFIPGKKMRFQGKAAVKEEAKVIVERDYGKPMPMSQIFNPCFIDYQLMLGADLLK